jgi:DNA-binding NtrC family response regulator
MNGSGMQVDELDLKDIFSPQSAAGTPLFVGNRALILDADALGLLRKELVSTLGVGTARDILTRFGCLHGHRMAEAVRTGIQWDDEEEWRKAGPRLYALQGMFRLEPSHADFTGPKGGSWRDSYEAEQHLLHHGKSEQPVCWTLCGLISGYLSRSLGREMVAIEDRCIGRGDKSCHVVVKPREEWGGLASSEIGSHESGIEEAGPARFDDASKVAESKKRGVLPGLFHMDGMADDMDVAVTRSRAMHALMDTAKTIAWFDSSVLITGESGTGKELIARFVHNCSSRADAPFVAVNCGAITETLLESELFGHVRGSFTGAATDRIGLFEAAAGGTLFLDEVGELPLAMQVKLLRAIQEREVRRVGENKSRSIDVRILSATNKDLSAEIEAKRFRQDLYYRLRVVELTVPPLRQRGEDILSMAQFFLAEGSRRMKRKVDQITPKAADRLVGYAWPGNVRELENVMERAVAVAKGRRVDLDDLPSELRQVTPMRTGKGALRKLTDVEKDCIMAALEATGGNRVKAANQLGISIATFYRKLKTYQKDEPNR